MARTTLHYTLYTKGKRGVYRSPMHFQWLRRHCSIHFTQKGRVVVVCRSPMHVQWLTALHTLHKGEEGGLQEPQLLGRYCSVRFTQRGLGWGVGGVYRNSMPFWHRNRHNYVNR